MTDIMENLDTRYPAFPSIPRLLRDVVITEKLDGTNALIHIAEDGTVRAGSRTRWITPGDDNYGFARWVADNSEALATGLGFGLHFGEWWGAGIQRRYGLTEKRFSLFNTGRWNSEYNTTGTGLTVCDEAPVCHVVPKLYTGTFGSEAVVAALSTLQAQGSVAAPSFMTPEGIVVYHTKSSQLYKVTLDKNDGHKGA